MASVPVEPLGGGTPDERDGDHDEASESRKEQIGGADDDSTDQAAMILSGNESSGSPETNVTILEDKQSNEGAVKSTEPQTEGVVPAIASPASVVSPSYSSPNLKSEVRSPCGDEAEDRRKVQRVGTTTPTLRFAHPGKRSNRLPMRLHPAFGLVTHPPPVILSPRVPVSPAVRCNGFMIRAPRTPLTRTIRTGSTLIQKSMSEREVVSTASDASQATKSEEVTPSVPDSAVHDVVQTSSSCASPVQAPVPALQAPVPDQQAPAQGQAPVPDQQAPAQGQAPGPDKQDPVPDKQDPVPDKQDPVLDKKDPVPGQQAPCPDKQDPVPDQQVPVPEKATAVDESLIHDQPPNPLNPHTSENQQEAQENTGDRENDLAEFRARFLEFVDVLKRKRVNVFEALDLEEVLKCVYEPMGCSSLLTSKEEFGEHMEECKYGVFSKCLLPGCEAGVKIAFGCFNELMDHVAAEHCRQIRMFLTPGINSQVVISTHIFDERRLDYIKVVGIATVTSNNVTAKVTMFVRIVTSRRFDGPRLIPFSICYGEDAAGNNLDQDLHFVPCIEAEYGIASIDQLKFSSDFKASSKAVAYRTLQAYLDDKDKHCRHFLSWDEEVENISKYQDESGEVFSLNVAAKFSATRIAVKNIDTEAINWLWSWRDLFVTNQHIKLFFQRLTEKKFRQPTGIMKAVPVLAYHKKFTILEARDNPEILIGTMIREVSVIYSEIYQFGSDFKRKGATDVSKEEIPEIPKLKDKTSVILTDPVPFSPAIIIVADCVQTCRLLKSEIISWFQDLVVVVGHDMRLPHVRQQVIKRCDIFIATISRLQTHMRKMGYYVVGSNTKLVIVHHFDRIMAKNGDEDVRAFLFPTLDKELKYSRKIFWTNKLLASDLQMMSETYWKGKDIAIISVGPVGAMGLEKVEYSKKTVKRDLQKKDVLRTFIRTNLNDFNHFTVVCKSKTALQSTEELLKQTVSKNVAVRHFTKDDCEDPENEVKKFFECNKKAIIIITPMLFNTIEFPVIEVLIMYGLPPNFVEFYRSTEVVMKKIFVIAVQSYGDDTHPELLKFEQDLKVLKK